MHSWSWRSAALAATALLATSCAGGALSEAGDPVASQTSTATASGSPVTSAPTTPTATAVTRTASATVTATPTSTPTVAASAAPTVSPAAMCATRLVGSLSTERQAGQLIWVGLSSGSSPASLKPLVTQRHLGGVVLLGGWHDLARVRSATTRLQSYATPSATSGIRLFISADQEGGQVQQLRGSGFSRIPSARAQDAYKPAQLRPLAAKWAKQLAAAGVNVNLAPVADTVPASLGAGNAPIGRYGRQFSSDPKDNARMVAGFVEGMHDGGVAATVKHFPGLGRIRANTDFSASGITDRTTTATDPYLEPFASGIRSGADFVMVGSAIYPRIDPSTNAVFSPKVITGLLREQMGYAGVVVTDDVGAAKAVSRVSVSARATRFIEAGGDIVLTAKPATVTPMVQAIVARTGKNPAFAAKVKASAIRVLTLKVERGLVRCG